jgi:hypothetical protein
MASYRTAETIARCNNQRGTGFEDIKDSANSCEGVENKMRIEKNQKMKTEGKEDMKDEQRRNR